METVRRGIKKPNSDNRDWRRPSTLSRRAGWAQNRPPKKNQDDSLHRCQSQPCFLEGGGREPSLNLHLLISASPSSLRQPPEGVGLHRCSEVRLLLPSSPRIHLATSHLLLSRFYPAASLCFTFISPPPSPAAIRAHCHNSILHSFKVNCKRTKEASQRGKCKGPAKPLLAPHSPPSFASNTDFQTSTVHFRFKIQNLIFRKSASPLLPHRLDDAEGAHTEVRFIDSSAALAQYRLFCRIGKILI